MFFFIGILFEKSSSIRVPTRKSHLRRLRSFFLNYLTQYTENKNYGVLQWGPPCKLDIFDTKDKPYSFLIFDFVTTVNILGSKSRNVKCLGTNFIAKSLIYVHNLYFKRLQIFPTSIQH